MDNFKIYYDSLDSPDLITSDCVRWDTQNYTVIVETLLTKSQLQTLRNNITPGAADELYTILGQPHYVDRTWSGENTIRIASDKNNLQNMRDDRILYVKSITDTPLKGDSGKLLVKIEGFVSGSSI